MNKNIIELKDLKGKVLYTSTLTNINRVIQEAIDKNINLDNADLSKLTLENINFYNNEYNGICFDKSHLSYVTFNKCILHNISYKNAILDHCDYINNILYDILFNNTFLNYCNYANNILDYIDFTFSNIVCTPFISNVINFAFFNNSVFGEGKFYNNSYTNIIGLEQASNVPYISNTYIPEGSLIGWKIFNPINIKHPPILIKLEIPKDALRIKCIDGICRCNKALVLEFQDKQEQTLHNITSVSNITFEPCTYTCNEIVVPDSWDSNLFNSCGHGIYFFLNKVDAINYINFSKIQIT